MSQQSTSPDDVLTGDLNVEQLDAGSTSRARKADHMSFAHRLYVSDFDIDFIGKRAIWFAISGVLLVACVVGLFWRGLNLGIEFKGGTQFKVEVASITQGTIGDYQQVVTDTGLPDMNATTITTMTNTSTVVVEVRTLTTDETTTLRDALAAKAGTTPEKVGYTLVGPSWGSQVTQKGIQALVIFLVLVALLIGLYFRNWKMSAAAMIGLIHDLIVTVGIYALVGFAVTPATITGVLTILGYSLYDNVVVFDKVRENTTDLTRSDQTYTQAADKAVNQVFVRSINTTIIAVLPVAAILFAGVTYLGGQGPLPDLGLAMLVGIITGAWSSIFIATPILAILKEAEPGMRAHREALAKRAARSAARISATVVPAEAPVTLASPVIPVTSAPVPVRTTDEVAAGRPQPVRQSRSQRKK
ncbi:MAG: protein translocase subunit SecF [Actinomycetia bacterium]|nr:protein translocase subunit SecF [Actinomycetes bacterium]